MRLSETARTILGLIAEGHSYDQILQHHPELSYLDIFAAAREVLDLAETATVSQPRSTVLPQLDQRRPLVAVPPYVDIAPPDGALAHTEPLVLEAPDEPVLATKRVSFVERARATHGRAFTRWSREEDARLEQLFREGTPRAEIVRQLDRHDGAIAKRLEKLGLVTETEHAAPPARRRSERKAPPPAKLQRIDETPSGQTAVPGWDLFRDRLSDKSDTP